MFSRLHCRLNPHSPSGSGGVESSQTFSRLAAGALAFCAVLALLFATFPASAQQSTGAIVGTVVDPTGAAIKGATVTAKDVDRGTVLTTHSNDTGDFNFPLVPVGSYQVKVEGQGFQAEVQPTFTLTLNQTARFSFKMKVGQRTETVEVTAAAPLLDTDTSLLSSLIDSRVATDLPLSTHNINQLTLIASPGVITPNLFGFQAGQNTFGTGRPYVNGAREQENNFILDGMDNNQPDNNDVAYVPSPEAIQEVNLITGNAPADFGSYLGGVVIVSIKSGTNEFHGGFYEYMRRGGMSANSWSNNLNGIPRPGQRYDDFGALLGGPIVRNK